MPKRPQPDASAKAHAIDALYREAEAFAVEQYAYIRTGEEGPAAPDLSAEGKARQLEEKAQRAGKRMSAAKRKELATKVASWRSLEKMDETTVLLHVFEVLERRAWDAEFVLIAGQRYPVATGLLAGDLLQTISQLADAASCGDEQALRSLLLVAREATIQLDRASRAQPVAASALAQTVPKWPAFVGPHGDNKSERERLIEALQIGAKNPLALKGKWSSKPSPGQPYRHFLGTYVGRVVGVIESARLRGYARVLRTLGANGGAARLPSWMADAESLPEFVTPGSVKRWCDVALQILVEAGGKKLGGLTGLAAMGKYRAGVRKRMGESPRQQSGQAEQAIRERFEKAFLTRYRPDPS